MRTRVRRAIDQLVDNVRPHHSLTMTPLFAIDLEVRRIKIEHWRIKYNRESLLNWFSQHASCDAEVGILAVHKRPPYQYDDLEELLTDLN